jgi:hypothetical protein
MMVPTRALGGLSGPTGANLKHNVRLVAAVPGNTPERVTR